MNMHVKPNVPALLPSLPDIVAEYDAKKAALAESLKAFELSIDTMKMSATIGGTLIAILPATARYDHGLLDHLIPQARWSTPWHDLPVGTFSESGTNINTTVLIIHRRKEDA